MLFSYLKEKNIACIVATHDAEDALSFADKMIVIQNNQIVAASMPQDLYKNPGSKYVASLFNDVNEILIQGKKELLYPHQIKIVESSEWKAKVINTYFKGTYWLTELNFNDQVVFSNHQEYLKRFTSVCIEFPSKS